MSGSSRHRHVRLALVSAPLVLFVLAGLLAPLLAPAGPTATDLTASLRPPGWGHLLGTDKLGRDEATRLLYAARTSLTVASSVLAISVSIGVVLGAVAGFVGGTVERITMRIVELAMSMPTLVVGLAILGIRGNGTGNLIIALSAFGWAPYARIARGVVAGHRRSPAVDALRVLGARPRRILGRHLVPIAVRPALVYASTDLGAVVLATASLSFLGLGVSPPTPEWGQMLVESRPYLATAIWLAIAPGAAVTLVVISSNLVSEHLATPAHLRAGRVRRPRRAAPDKAVGPEVAIVPAPPALPVGRGRPLLDVVDLSVSYPAPAGGELAVVHRVSMSVARGRTLAIVGESGGGKTTSVLAAVGLLPDAARVGGSALLDGRQLVGLRHRELRSVYGRRVGVVFQDPFHALNPLRSIGSHVDEAVHNAGTATGRHAVRRRSLELLAEVGLTDPASLVGRRPHELSGGMRQRVLLAIALAGDPDLLIADEPASALDVTSQAQLVGLLGRLADERQLAMIVVSHDLAMVAGIADDVIVMRDGRVVERGPVGRLLSAPGDAYTRSLIAAVPRLDAEPGTRFAVAAELVDA